MEAPNCRAPSYQFHMIGSPTTRCCCVVFRLVKKNERARPGWLGGSRQNTNTFARWEGGEVKIAAHELVRLILGLAWD